MISNIEVNVVGVSARPPRARKLGLHTLDLQLLVSIVLHTTS
jgi:hypothetical protein